MSEWRRYASRFAPVAALLVFATAAGIFRIKSSGLFWHLATGRWILDHGRLPRTDPFRFTAEAAPWADHEWLFQVVAGAIERLAGLNGLIVVRAGAAAALAALLLVGLRRSGVSAAAAVPVVLVASLGARPRMLLRPELVTLLMLALFLALLQEARRADRRSGWFVAAILLVVPWVNFHPGALVAPPVAGSYLLGWRLGGIRSGLRKPSWLLVLGLPALVLAALTVNPNGYRVLTFPFEVSRSLEGLGGVNPEWLPLWEGSVARDSPYFFSVLAALAALVFVTLRRAPAGGAGSARAPWLARLRSLDGATGLTALALLALPVTSIRHQPLFYVGASFFAGECLARLRHSDVSPGVEGLRGARDERRLGLLATTLCLLALFWVVLPPSRGPLSPKQGRFQFGLGLEPDRFPEGQVRALRAWGERNASGGETASGGRVGPLYNNLAWGGYLLWRMFPPRQVFVDGRNHVDPGILRELSAARRSNAAWDQMLERHGIDGAIVRYEQRTLRVIEASPETTATPREVRRTPNALFFPRERFALVYWDDAGMLLLRRTPERAAAIRAVETRWVDPEDLAWTLRRAGEEPAFRERAIAEVRRKLAQDPSCARARALLDSLFAL